MAYPKLKIADDDGNVADVTSNRLDVNAYLSATPTIDIGDVSLLLGGTAASVNNGAADATTLRVTVASNSTGVISVDDNGGALTVDGTVTANLSATDNAVLDAMVVDLAAMEALLITIDSDTDAIKTAVQVLDDWDDSNYANVNMNIAGTDAIGGAGAVASGVQRVTLASDDPAVVDLAAIEVLITSTNSKIDTFDAVLDNILTKNTEIDAVLDTIKVDTEAIETAVELLDNAISGSEMQVDIVASLPAGSAAIGKLAPNSGVDIGDVDVTSTVTPAGNDTLNSYGRFDAAETPTAITDATNGINATETAAKEVILQTADENSGYVRVGDSGSAATQNGIRLNAGDTLILPVADISNIYIDGSAASQKVFVTIIK